MNKAMRRSRIVSLFIRYIQYIIVKVSILPGFFYHLIFQLLPFQILNVVKVLQPHWKKNKKQTKYIDHAMSKFSETESLNWLDLNT